ncbi:CPBP family intramembrane metalloprotease [Salinimicrobium tongyeongense]|uniref:CPBP family intramembrane metalloprotease n=1 Tax=Salinimicrobium tongyeongense TaxID=2809707 RepID=A0ABY6NUM9_9FLAO|nr:type II CAAX endopeptidase family protein [Salinimicrobium tongyeongense]UZH56612.1 CPBP family intramembrane metalloprotease [Salinimicrobium tongyeongense]
MGTKEFRISGWARILLFLFPYFLIVVVFQFIGLVVAGISIDDPLSSISSQQHLISSFFDLSGTFLVLWIFMKYIDREKFTELGFQMKGRLSDFGSGTLVGFITMLSGFLILMGIGEIRYSGVNFNVSELLISILFFLIIAVVEETLIRGYVLKNLMLSTNKYVALVISSVIFSLMHGANPSMSLFSFIDLFFAGMILGISYLYTKNLWFPIGLHFGWNLFQTHFGFNVSGLDVYSLIEINYTSANLFNGGEFGFEGSVFSVAAQLLIFAGIVNYYQDPAQRFFLPGLLFKRSK